MILVLLIWLGMLVVALDALQPKRGQSTMRIWKKSDNGNWYGYGNGHKAVIYSHVDTDEVTVRVYDRFELLVEVFVKANVAQAKRYAEKNYLRGTK